MEIKRERRWSTVYQAASETETQETQEALVLFLAFYPSAPLFPSAHWVDELLLPSLLHQLKESATIYKPRGFLHSADLQL